MGRYHELSPLPLVSKSPIVAGVVERRGWHQFFIAAIIAVMAVSVMGIGPATAQSAPGTKTKVLVRFTWKLKGEDAPLFVALDKGYYAAEGLDVELAEGSGAETVVKLIGNGTDKIGYGPATTAAEAISRGLPIEVVAVYQPEVPIALVSFPDVPLKTPKDLEGKKLGVSIGETFGNLLEPFARLNHVNLSKITKVQMDNSARNAQFMARKLDVTTVYLNNELPLFEKKAGVKFNVVEIADFGLKLLGASFFVNREYAAQNGETLKKLLRATAKGYLDAKKDLRGAATIMDKYMRVKLDRDVLMAQIKATLDATPVPQGKPLGWQDAAAWKNNLELLKSTGIIKKIGDMKLYYTNALLD